MTHDALIYNRGKLQIARSIIDTICCLFCDNIAVKKDLDTAWYALNRADAALDVESQKPSPNTRSLQLLLDGFKKDYPNLSQKTIHAVNAFVLYAQQQQAGA
jgi:acetyl/propionyl-CoA carboxylase alpha subunit